MFRPSLQWEWNKTSQEKKRLRVWDMVYSLFRSFGLFPLSASHRVALSNDYTRNVVIWHLSDLNTFSYYLPNSTHLSWRRTPTRFDNTVQWRCQLIRTCNIWFYFIYYLSTWTLKIRLHLLYDFKRLFIVIRMTHRHPLSQTSLWNHVKIFNRSEFLWIFESQMQIFHVRAGLP